MGSVLLMTYFSATFTSQTFYLVYHPSNQQIYHQYGTLFHKTFVETQSETVVFGRKPLAIAYHLCRTFLHLQGYTRQF